MRSSLQQQMEEHEELVNHPQIAINNQTGCVIEPDVPKCEVCRKLYLNEEKNDIKIQHDLIHLREFCTTLI